MIKLFESCLFQVIMLKAICFSHSPCICLETYIKYLSLLLYSLLILRIPVFAIISQCKVSLESSFEYELDSIGFIQVEFRLISLVCEDIKC